jgi:hypothetical protein
VTITSCLPPQQQQCPGLRPQPLGSSVFESNNPENIVCRLSVDLPICFVRLFLESHSPTDHARCLPSPACPRQTTVSSVFLRYDEQDYSASTIWVQCFVDIKPWRSLIVSAQGQPVRRPASLALPCTIRCPDNRLSSFASYVSAAMFEFAGSD